MDGWIRHIGTKVMNSYFVKLITTLDNQVSMNVKVAEIETR